MIITREDFADDLSKQIFDIRQTFSQTNNLDTICKLVALSSKNTKSYIKKILNSIKLSHHKDLIIYGAGTLGKIAYSIIKNEGLLESRTVLFCDKNYEQVKALYNIPVVSPDKLKGNIITPLILVCATGSFKRSIYDFLQNETSIHNESILLWPYIDEQECYFDPVISFAKDEVFIDAGGYEGETAIEFAKRVNNTHKKIYIFEPDEKNAAIAQDTILQHGIHSYTIACIGLWDKKETLQFTINGTGSAINTSGDITINADSLDSYLQKNGTNSEVVTYIKMDIEGAEYKALVGAQNTIQKDRPKLAISMYHKPEDILEIPTYIKKLVPEYKFYLRHYTNYHQETVLYAIPL